MKSNIIAKGIDLSQALREYIMQSVDFAMDRAQDSINFITVRISDLNGPKGGVDKRCQIHLKIVGSPELVVTGVSASISGAIDRATQRAARVVERILSKADAVQPIKIPVLRRIAM